ncbi:hypothetical protein LCGC14_1970360 [marine sediment metagenome]|uniref:Uncharacterized protein n=1 Tax=marine sediment metagenome TaxID=412755 RepID=A0A0F9HQA1_9ZZZZ
MTRAYIARVEARTGLLLGGGRVHESYPFEDYRDAVAWTDTIIEGNAVAGRDAMYGGIRMVQAEKPILRKELV